MESQDTVTIVSNCFRTIHVTARRNLNKESSFPFLGIFVAIIQPLRSKEALSVAPRGKRRKFFLFFHISFLFFFLFILTLGSQHSSASSFYDFSADFFTISPQEFYDLKIHLSC